MPNARVTTVDDVKSFFYELIKKEHDADHTLQIINQADGMLRRERPWQMLRKIDSSQSASIGDTYLTAKTLVSDIDRPLPRIYVGTTPFRQCPFEQRILYKDTPHRFYIDWRSNQFFLTGTQGAAATIEFPYIYRPLPLQYEASVTVGTDTETPSWWPVDLRVTLSYICAKIYQGNLAPDDISYRMSKEQEREMDRLVNILRDWDASLELAAMDERGGFDVDSPNIDTASGLIKLGDLG